jgi:effector-binding domain-containing protein
MNKGINLVSLEAVTAMAIRETLPVGGLTEFFGRAFGRLGEYIGRAGGQMAGPPFAVYHNAGEPRAEVEAAFPVVKALLGEDDITPIELPGGDAIEYVYFGPYDAMASVYLEIDRWLKEHGKTKAGPPREVYYSEPQGDPASWETHVVQPYS